MRARTQRLLAGGLVAVLALVLLLEPQRGASLGQAASPVAASSDGGTSRRTFQSLAAADAGTESSASPATGQPSGVHHNLENVAELVDDDAGTDVSSTVMDTQGNMTLAVNDTTIMTTSTSVETVAPTTGSTTAPVITDQSSSAAPVQPTTETGASPTTSTNTAAPSSASPTTEGPLMTWPANTTSPLTSTAATAAPPLSTTPVELPTNVTLPSFPPVTMPNATENVSTTFAPRPNLTLTTSTPNVTFPLTQSPTTAAVPPLPSPTPVELRVHVFCSASNNHVDSWAFESDGNTMDPVSTFDFVVDSTEPNVDIDAHVADLCDALRASSAPIPTRLVDIVCSPRASGDDTWFFSDPALRPLVSLVGVVVSDTVISSDTMMAAFVAKECDMWRSDLLNSTTTVAPVPVNTTQPPMFVPANLTIVCPQRTATPCSVANVSGCWSNASAAAANQPPEPWWAELPWWAHYVAWDGRSGSLTLEVNASRWNTTEALGELEAVVCRKAVNVTVSTTPVVNVTASPPPPFNTSASSPNTTTSPLVTTTAPTATSPTAPPKATPEAFDPPQFIDVFCSNTSLSEESADVWVPHDSSRSAEDYTLYRHELEPKSFQFQEDIDDFVYMFCWNWRTVDRYTTPPPTPVPQTPAPPTEAPPVNLTIRCPSRMMVRCLNTTEGGTVAIDGDNASCWSNASAAAANKPPEPWWAELPWWAHYVAWDGQSGSLTLEVNASRWNTTEDKQLLESVVCRKAVNFTSLPITTAASNVTAPTPSAPPSTPAALNQTQMAERLLTLPYFLERTPIFTAITSHTDIGNVNTGRLSDVLAQELRFVNPFALWMFAFDDPRQLLPTTACKVATASVFEYTAISPEICLAELPCDLIFRESCPDDVLQCSCPFIQPKLPLNDSYATEAPPTVAPNATHRRRQQGDAFVQVQFPIRLDKALSYTPESDEAALRTLEIATASVFNILRGELFASQFGINTTRIFLRYAYQDLRTPEPSAAPFVPIPTPPRGPGDSEGGGGSGFPGWAAIFIVLPLLGVISTAARFAYRRYRSSRAQEDDLQAEASDANEGEKKADPSAAAVPKQLRRPKAATEADAFDEVQTADGSDSESTNLGVSKQTGLWMDASGEADTDDASPVPSAVGLEDVDLGSEPEELVDEVIDV